MRLIRRPPSGSWKLGNSRMASTRRWVIQGYPWQGQFETLEEVKDYLSEDRIDCLLCGRALKSLSMHLARIHGISCDRYKEQFGIPYTCGLISADVSDQMSERMSLIAKHEPLPVQGINLNRRPMCKAITANKRALANKYRPIDRALLSKYGKMQAKVTEDIVRAIKDDLILGMSHRKAATKYGLSKTTITRVIKS